MHYKELIEKVKIFRNEKPTKWSPDEDAYSYLNKIGNTMCGIGELEKFVKAGKSNGFIFCYLAKNEIDRTKEFEANNKNKGEKLVRYITRNTAAGGMLPLCILNADKGYMRFMDNIDDDPDLEDAVWSKPQKFEYLRVIY